MTARPRLGSAGSTATEFALVLPVFLSLLFAVIESGIMLFAFTGLQNTASEAAREATLFPRRTDEQLLARVEASRFGLDPARLAAPQIVRGVEGGQEFVEITLRYEARLGFGIASLPAITLSQTRRAYLPDA